MNSSALVLYAWLWYLHNSSNFQCKKAKSYLLFSIKKCNSFINVSFETCDKLHYTIFYFSQIKCHKKATKLFRFPPLGFSKLYCKKKLFRWKWQCVQLELHTDIYEIAFSLTEYRGLIICSSWIIWDKQIGIDFMTLAILIRKIAVAKIRMHNVHNKSSSTNQK